MIKILHVLNIMDRGGAESMLMNLYRNIDRHEIQFGFVVHQPQEGMFDKEIKKLGGELFVVPAFLGYNIQTYKKAFRDILIKHPEYVIVHAHMQSTAAVYLKVAKQMGKITVSHSHNTSSGEGIKALLKNVIQFPIRFEADYLFACSQLAGIWLYGKQNVYKHKVDIIYNAIDIEQFRFNPQKRSEMRLEKNLQNNLVIGHVGRFNHQKNHELLVQIFRYFLQTHSNAILLLLGKGEEEKRIRQLVTDIGISGSVRFLGVQDNINEWMQAMDIFLFPSLYEGLPVTVVEAQASGLPCVISETITDEVILCHVEKVPLKAGLDQWGKAIEDALANKSERAEGAETIGRTGFNVREAATTLQEKYFKMVEKGIQTKWKRN